MRRVLAHCGVLELQVRSGPRPAATAGDGRQGVGRLNALAHSCDIDQTLILYRRLRCKKCKKLPELREPDTSEYATVCKFKPPIQYYYDISMADAHGEDKCMQVHIRCSVEHQDQRLREQLTLNMCRSKTWARGRACGRWLL
jgi:hypothetical protein